MNLVKRPQDRNLVKQPMLQETHKVVDEDQCQRIADHQTGIGKFYGRGRPKQGSTGSAKEICQKGEVNQERGRQKYIQNRVEEDDLIVDHR